MDSSEFKPKTEAEKPPIKAVIFDLDGLLIDSESAWDETYYIFLENHHVVDKPEVSGRMTGMGLREAVELMIDKMGLKGDLESLVSEYREMFYKKFFERKDVFFDGAVGLIKGLEKKGFKLAVATGGHAKEKCSQIIESMGLGKYFDVVVSSDDVRVGKPAPDVYLETVRQLGVQPLNCLVLEDSVNGILAAKDAGMRVYGVNSNKEIRKQLKNAGADRVYCSLSEVDEI